MATKKNYKNITNGAFELQINEEDIASPDLSLSRSPNGNIYDTIQKGDKTNTSYYIQNLRTGSFSQISQNYLIQSRSAKSHENQFTTNIFETQMKMLKLSVETQLSKSISFFQGIFAGMALLYTITLNLSQSVSIDLVRVEDHSIRVVSLLSTLGSFFSMIRARDRYQSKKLSGTSLQIDERYKCLVLCVIQMIFYSCSYIVYNVSHTYSISYNIAGTNYSQVSILTTIYTVLCLLGWIVTNINSKKHQK